MSGNTSASKMERRATEAGITLIGPSDFADAVRVGILLVAGDKTHAPQMEKIDRLKPLVNVIADLCELWKLEDPQAYQLQFDDKKVLPPPIYITEENRDKMKNGDILKLNFSPQKMSRIMVAGFQKENLSLEYMTYLAKLSTDITFVEHFVTQKGFIELTKFIAGVANSGQLSNKSGPALLSFVEIMEHSIVSWETIDAIFIDHIIWYVQAKHEPNLLVVKSSLAILQCAILNSSAGQLFAVEARIDIIHFVSTLKTRDIEIQILCISLINTILLASTPIMQARIRKQLLSMPIRQLVWENIFTGPVCDDMAFQLCSLQKRMLNLLSDRLLGAINTKDGAALKEVAELCHIAFDDVVDTAGITKPITRVNDTRDFTKLGFKNPAEPLQEFQQAPPGALALDCMAFFAHQYTTQYRQVVLENSRERADEQDCPFAQASVELTMLLADILKIGVHQSDKVQEDDRTYYPMFFFKEKPFEECFCVCIQRLTRTWKEMKASLSDFNKVLMVVREQITRALGESPHTFDSLKTKLTFWSFAKIQEARQTELEKKEEQKRQAKPIRELREMIKPEIELVIRQQRINRMIHGFHFRTSAKANKARNEKYLYCRLSQNAKVLHYGSTTSDQAIPETLNSINILDIDDVRESDETKGRRTISITKQGGEELQLNTDDQMDHDIWLDGLYALTGRVISSKQAQLELDELLSMEVKLRLLDAEGINFPEDPPPIPNPPANFNFVTV